MEYNTSRDQLKLREYGRNIHKLINHIKTVEDRDKRNVYAETMVELMKLINPAMKDSPEYAQKLWDDLFIMADYDLDIDSPFPQPQPHFDKKPDRVKYPKMDMKFKHYGKNVELLIEKAIELEDAEEKEAATIHIGKLMKAFYGAWNKDTIDDGVVLKNIRQLSQDKLDLDLEKVREQNLFDSSRMMRDRDRENQGSNDRNRRSGGRGRRNNNQRRRRN